MWGKADEAQSIGALRAGLEAGINTQLAGWRISGNLTLLDPRNRTTGRLLTDRNEQAIRIDIDREFGPTELGATLQARSHSYSNATNTFRTAGFGTLDLRVAHHLSSEWTLRGQVRNLFDRDYETIRTYNTGGRELFVSVHYEAK